MPNLLYFHPPNIHTLQRIIVLKLLDSNLDKHNYIQYAEYVFLKYTVS